MLQLDSYATLVAATLVLLLGRLLVTRVGLLRTFNIPKPVAGGLVVALVLLLLRSTLQMELQFDTSLQTPLMLAFFASIGLSADLASLKRGGKAVLTFLLVVTGLLLVQNSLGVGLATLLGLDPHMGCWPAPSPSPVATAPGRPGAPPSPKNTGCNPPPNWPSPVPPSAWCWAASSAARSPAIW